MAHTEREHVWQAVGAEKRESVRRLFREIAPSYDLMNSVMSLRLHHRWRAEAVKMLNLHPGSRVADLCCGTGDFVPPLRKAIGPTGCVAGFDFCPEMLGRARDKRLEAGFVAGDTCSLPIRTASVDAVTVGWGLRNVADLEAALGEIRRVLRPGGKFVSVDMAVPKSPLARGISAGLFKTVVPALGTLLGKRKAYQYLPKSTERFATREEQEEAILAAGFREAGHKDLFFGNICIHWGQA